MAAYIRICILDGGSLGYIYLRNLVCFTGSRLWLCVASSSTKSSCGSHGASMSKRRGFTARSSKYAQELLPFNGFGPERVGI